MKIIGWNRFTKFEQITKFEIFFHLQGLLIGPKCFSTTFVYAFIFGGYLKEML